MIPVHNDSESSFHDKANRYQSINMSESDISGVGVSSSTLMGGDTSQSRLQPQAKGMFSELAGPTSGGIESKEFADNNQMACWSSLLNRLPWLRQILVFIG